jgi:DNA-binding MarR family transcriptional regulator
VDDEDLLRLVVRAQIGLWETVDAALRASHGLPLGRYLPMRVIAQTPDCRVQDISAALRITTSGASQAVDRIVARGDVARGAHQTDRRSSVLVLTAQGRQTLDAASSTLQRVLGSALSVLPAGQRDELTAALSTLEAALPR